jgi:hypothetical protein
LLWSDPIDPDNTYGLTQRDYEEWFTVDYVDNPNRGTGYIFNVTALKRFLQMNNLVSIIRAHEVQKEGYYEHTFKLPNPQPRPPLCITLFSAPNCMFTAHLQTLPPLLHLSLSLSLSPPSDSRSPSSVCVCVCVCVCVKIVICTRTKVL